MVLAEGMSVDRRARTLGLMVCALVACAAGAVYSPHAAAQPATLKPGSGDDFRAAYAGAADVAEGKKVAETSCARCHGTNGISVMKGVPHLAGQRAAYLHLELRAYQSGARDDKTMD